MGKRSPETARVLLACFPLIHKIRYEFPFAGAKGSSGKARRASKGRKARLRKLRLAEERCAELAVEDEEGSADRMDGHNWAGATPVCRYL
ncbi:hypothetical protein RB213_005356 [Colletotrichum asianum]